MENNNPSRAIDANARMNPLTGYLFEVLRSGDEFTMYRARRPSAPPVLAVTITARQASARSLERLDHEYALGADLDSAWAVRPLALTRHDERPMLLLEDDGAEPLDRILDKAEGKRLELGAFLRVASALARALGQMHRNDIVHKDVKPANVLVGDAGRVRLTGFGIASRLRRERQLLAPPEIIAGTFAYMAPEQTGRMNRSVDARTDLYSFGVTLYELLTGTLPFTASNPMGWIHCHVARPARPPSEQQRGLPAAVDDIILKLLSKNPEDRYQTAAGVETDLRKCLRDWEARGSIGRFTLAERDVPERLLMPERLYGRDVEIKALRTAFERVVNDGRTEIVLVSGYAGIGKSSIVNELHKVLVPWRGLFATGKFDQYKRDVPYATLAQAFQGLTRQLLSKNDEELSLWREQLTTALGANAQLMVNLIPELALVIGEQPPVPRLDPQEASARFHAVFRSLLGVFARAEHPLVLFLDDLQWLDAGTLELLQRLAADEESRHLLLIGAYRDNEVGPTHPLLSTLTAICGANSAVSQLTLSPLRLEHLAQLAADALHSDVVRVAPLAELILEKTGGNPFFAGQFIMELANESLLIFDPRSFSWQWDIERIRAKSITDNVADLMTAKLSRLAVSTREVLGQLACLGNAAELATLASLHEASETEVLGMLRDAIEVGLILLVNRSVAFSHDRVHEAAYASIPADRRAAVHLRIGRMLKALTPSVKLEEEIFEIVNQFGRAASEIDSPAERELVAELHLIAGGRAKASSAYASAQAYFAAGRALLGDGSWDGLYRLTFDLELRLAECEIIGGELAGAEERLTLLAQRAVGLTDQADVVCLAALLYFTTGRSERAVEVALEFLRRAGIVWSARPTEADVRQELLQLHRHLSQRPIETLISRAPMHDPACIAVMAVLTELFPAAYAVDRYLMDLVVLRMTNLSLEHGTSESSAIAYSALSMALGSYSTDYATVYRLGELACQLVERRGMDRYRGRVYSLFPAFSMPWMKHLPLCQPLMTQAFLLGSSTGDTAFAAYNSRNLVSHLLVSGVPLGQVQREAEQAIAFARKVELGMPAEWFFGQIQLIQRLRGAPAESQPAHEEWARQEVEHYPGLAMMVCYYWVFRLQERYLAADIPAALDAAARVSGIRWAMRSSIEEAEYELYAALARAAACEGASAEQREVHLRALHEHGARIAIWAEHCPENFANRRALVAAEIARLEGRAMEAQGLYEQAVQLARKHGFVQNEAIASQLAGYFHAAGNMETIAVAYLRQARECYERWGALAMLKQLDARHPLLRPRLPPSPLAATVDKPVAHLDVEAVDKASQTLSSEMVLPSLLEKLMRLAMEHAGAQRGLLILLQDDEPHVEAEATTGSGSVDVVVRSVRVVASHLPVSVLQYALRTHERVAFDDAATQGLDPDDPYLRQNRPHSVLCLPIFKQTKVVGALYLENNLTTHAFTSDRVAVLDFLASQAAIALENARLYGELRRSEALLKEAQHLSSTGSFYWRADLDVIEYSEQTCRIYEFDPNRPVTLALMASRTHPEDATLLKEMIARARGPGSDLDYFYRLQMPNLSIKYLHLVAHGTRDKQGRLEYIGAIQDVTQRRLSEEALGKVRSELAHVARVTGLGVLAASIAHEVNQPLAAIVTNASTCQHMLNAEPPNLDVARETARRMIRDGQRASDVIKRLRALFSRRATVSERVDMNEAAREVLALSESELQKSGAVLRLELAADLPPVTGDRVQLQQVVLNLLLNAMDAMRGVHDRQRLLRVRTEREGEGQVRLLVQDAGVGFEPQSMPQLFEAFFTTKSGGMGIGLSVSRSIIESHGGRLWAAPNEGPGATFAFSLPCAQDGVPGASPPGTADAVTRNS